MILLVFIGLRRANKFHKNSATPRDEIIVKALRNVALSPKRVSSTNSPTSFCELDQRTPSYPAPQKQHPLPQRIIEISDNSQQLPSNVHSSERSIYQH
jgi:hypothetical protein